MDLFAADTYCSLDSPFPQYRHSTHSAQQTHCNSTKLAAYQLLRVHVILGSAADRLLNINYICCLDIGDLFLADLLVFWRVRFGYMHDPYQPRHIFQLLGTHFRHGCGDRDCRSHRIRLSRLCYG